MDQLTGKGALVCGGSRGIGRACAVELAHRGAEVTVVSRTEATLRDTVSTLATGANQAHAYVCADSSDPVSYGAKIADHVKRRGPMHILVNNTGGPPAGLLSDAKPEHLAGAFANHVLCSQLLVRTLLEGMKQAGYGRIINIISTSVITPIKGLGVSNTIRGAVANWGRTLAGELGPFGITVNNVLPGYFATDRLMSLFETRAQNAGTSVEDITRNAVEEIPMHRLGEPAEIGAVVAFLASPAASYLTGVNLPVDGGRTSRQ
ncbi:MAG: SDR family oxidoreductase [Phycisphaerales bacterium]|nr:MAG: SDR family oxidoreductase [Phycisphaerales bacterium]